MDRSIQSINGCIVRMDILKMSEVVKNFWVKCSSKKIKLHHHLTYSIWHKEFSRILKIHKSIKAWSSFLKSV